MKEKFQAVINDKYANIYNHLVKSMRDNKKEFVITANAEIFMASNDDKTINDMLVSQDHFVVADGISIIKAAKYYGIDIKEKIPGVDLCRDLLDYATKEKKKVYVFGCKEDVLDNLKNKYPSTRFVGLKNGYTNNAADVAKDILEKNPDLVLVALGVPKQELFINDIYSKVKKGIFIGVGGSIDVLSGSKKRAPKFFVNHNLEWLYRIVREPKRFKRFRKNNLQLLKLARKENKK